MDKEIVNRVSQSALEVFDLEDYYVSGKRLQLDIKDWLHMSFVLKEKEFRTAIQEADWSHYDQAYVAVHCGNDALVPTWAYMLVSSVLEARAKKIVFGDLETLETAIYREVLDQLDYSVYENKPVIIKGCSKKPVPIDAYLYAQGKLQAVAKKISFGEACSSVPLWKK
ncbi:MAG: DUF2480 family protein [Flavobacteriaceae bacterium]|nr:DUF2480 family protein [Flavobacteriaceae bacterium]